MEKLAPLRNRELEDPLNEFIREVCRDENIKPPGVLVVPKDIVLQVSEGETWAATYEPATELIYITPEGVWMDILLHELGHHINWKRRGMQYLRERAEEIRRGVPLHISKHEAVATEFMRRGIVNRRYIRYWWTKIEPVLPGRVMKV